jgi:hypothetical protein
MRKISKIMVKTNIAFPHEYDELAKNNSIIERGMERPLRNLKGEE